MNEPPLASARRKLAQALGLALAAALGLGAGTYAWPGLEFLALDLPWLARFAALIAGAGCAGAAVYCAGAALGHVANHLWTRGAAQQEGWVVRPHLWRDNYRFCCREDLVDLRVAPALLSESRLLFFGLAAACLGLSAFLGHRVAPALLARGPSTPDEWTQALLAAIMLPGGVAVAALGSLLTSRRRLLLEAHGPLKVLSERRFGAPGERTLPRRSRLRVLNVQTESGLSWIVRVADPDHPDQELGWSERVARTLMSGSGPAPAQVLSDVKVLDAALARVALWAPGQVQPDQRGGKEPEGEGKS